MEILYKSLEKRILTLEAQMMAINHNLEQFHSINQKLSSIINKWLAENEEDENVTR